MALSFLKDFKKSLGKMDNVVTEFGAPSFWYSTGNLALNKAISGSFSRGIPQGRVTCLAGPSGAGKSFILCNALVNAQKQGAFVLLMDSEHALDKGWLSRIGMDLSDDNFMYAGVTTFMDVVQVLSDFVSTYEKSYGRGNKDAPSVVIALDSLDMLITDSENDNFDKGVQKGDQGQRAKQAKQMLRTIVSRIKRNNMAFFITHQVYPNTDLLNGQGLWIINNAIRYSASQILLITPAKLKEGTEIIGVRMRCETYKSRFAKIGTKVEVQVPWDKGMDPYSGFLEMLEEAGVVTASGAWKKAQFPGEPAPISFQTKNLDQALVSKLLNHPLIKEEEDTVLSLMNDPDLPEDLDEKESDE